MPIIRRFTIVIVFLAGLVPRGGIQTPAIAQRSAVAQPSAVPKNASAAATAPHPPAQPAQGPGGAEALHRTATKHRYGQGGTEYWIYEPAAPTPTTATVVIFLHGWGGTNPAIYGAWIDHLVRRGSIVIDPRYQADNRTALSQFTPNTIAALHDAFRVLQVEAGHVRPDLTKVAVVGHSVGGLLAANVAALAQESNLPRLRAVMSVEPGRTWNPLPMMNVPLSDLSRIRADTLLLTVTGDDDTLARDTDAKRIFHESTHVPAANKNYIVMHSDNHGKPELKATHFAPVAPDMAYASGEPMTFGRGRGGSAGGDTGGRLGGTGASGSASGTANGPLRQAIRGRIEQRLEERGARGVQIGGGAAAAGTSNSGGDQAGNSNPTPQPDIMAGADPAMFGIAAPGGASARLGGSAAMPFAMPRPGVDALDTYGLWKLFDALCDAAFYNKNRDYALGNTIKQRYMGQWSDGTAVKPLTIISRP